jgi:hypothetical protein
VCVCVAADVTCMMLTRSDICYAGTHAKVCHGELHVTEQSQRLDFKIQ